MKEVSEYISDLPFYGHLTKDQKDFVSENLSIRKVDKGEQLYGYGKVCLGMAHVISGKIRVYIVSEEGREITLYNIEKGDNCVMSASCVITQIKFDTVMTAEENSEILVLNAGAFSKLAEENIYVKEFMYELATERFSQVMWVMQEIIFFSFDRRLAIFLLREYENTGKNEIKMTQEEIAKNVNSSREVVARMLKRFSSENIIEIRHGKIILTDIGQLNEIVKS